ncbi:MAG: glycosyltransferase family 2 protein [Actinobacteria bacterium]|nr:glycosyltransferase family 2 protein [Actinomycetota bacterium]
MALNLSIIIINYNSKLYIKKCIESIFLFFNSKKNDVKFGWEIIIVDNASNDGSVEFIEKKISEAELFNIRLIKLSDNSGFSKASNIGAKNCRGEFLLFLNPDTEIIQEGLENILKFYNEKLKTEKIGVIGVKILNPDGSLQYSCRSFPTLARQFYESFFLQRLFKKSRFFGSYFMTYWDHYDNKKVDWLTGAFMLICRETFFQAGCFDEDYFIYSEDTDLCLRLVKNGFINYYCSDYSLRHTDAGIASQNPALREYQIWKSRKLYFKKNYSNFHAFILNVLYLAGVLNRIAVFGIPAMLKSKNPDFKTRFRVYINTLKLWRKQKY